MGILRPGSIKIERSLKKYPDGRPEQPDGRPEQPPNTLPHSLVRLSSMLRFAYAVVT